MILHQIFISVIPWLMTPLWPLHCRYLRSESAEKLDVLSKKLQSVQDIDELTKMVLRGKKAWNVLTLLRRPLVTNFSVSLWSSVQPASTRRGRWSEQPSERSETSSSQASAAVGRRRGCLSSWTMHLLTDSINMWHQLFVKCGIFFSLFSGILNADFEQEALSIRVAIITQLFTEILRVVHASEIWDKASLCGGESWQNPNQFWDD